jgi:hypothetical protein
MHPVTLGVRPQGKLRESELLGTADYQRPSLVRDPTRLCPGDDDRWREPFGARTHKIIVSFLSSI